MDCTLFDYKFSLPDQQPQQQRTNSHPNILFHRPSSQSYKAIHTPPAITLQDSRPINIPPQMPASTRVRPTTAISRQARGLSNNVTRHGSSALIEELNPEEELRIIEKTTTLIEPVPLQKIQKIMPNARHIQADKESLYIDTLHMKQHVNAIKEENNLLKARNLALERENVKLVKTVEKLGTDNIQYGKPVESALIISLKKQVKELKEELQIRIDELDEMKKNTKYTKFQELEIELKAYADENIRLRGILEEVMKNKPEIQAQDYNEFEEKFYMQNNQIDALKRDHARLSSEMKYVEDQNYNLQVARETEVRNNQKLLNEISKLKKQMREKDMKLMPWLKPENFAHFLKGPAQKTEEKPRVEVDLTEWKLLVEQKDQVISQREKTLEDLRLKYNEKINTEHKEKQNHALEIGKWKEQYTDLESRYRALVNMHYSQDKKLGEGKSGSKYDEDLSESRVDKSFGFEIKNKKVKRLIFDDVSSLGYELSLKLRARRIFLEDIMKLLDKYGPKVSMTDMKNILLHEPFGIKDENNALLIARYLVEPNEEEFLLFDLNRVQDMVIIKSVFRKLVGYYTPLEEEEERIMNDEVGEFIHKYEQSLRTQFAVIPESKTGYLSSEQISKTFTVLGIHISPKNFEYLLMNLYEYTNSLKKLDYLKMFEIFETEEHKRLKKIIESYQNQNEGGFDSERSHKRGSPGGNDIDEQNSNSPDQRGSGTNEEEDEDLVEREGGSFGEEPEEEEEDGEEFGEEEDEQEMRR